jgi:hypothetical protein
VHFSRTHTVFNGSPLYSYLTDSQNSTLGVTLTRTDYTLDCMVKIFAGNDAVLSLNAGSLDQVERIIIDAVVKTGVKIFAPNGFWLKCDGLRIM